WLLVATPGAAISSHVREGRRDHARRLRRSSATSRSWGVVTLKLSAPDSTSLTVPPWRSTSIASSVAARMTSAGSASARSSASRRNACGVCTAHRRERSSVAETTRSEPASLTVSVTRAAAMAASAVSSSARQRVKSSG
ncbi:MAG: hypothetical protein AVDCRST_MAG30-3049, partial [uncultured Solirubrobacteraceae bacterium]